MTDDQVPTSQPTSAADQGRGRGETAGEQPAIVIVSGDPHARRRLDRELSRRYGMDYRRQARLASAGMPGNRAGAAASAAAPLPRPATALACLPPVAAGLRVASPAHGARKATLPCAPPCHEWANRMQGATGTCDQAFSLRVHVRRPSRAAVCLQRPLRHRCLGVGDQRGLGKPWAERTA